MLKHVSVKLDEKYIEMLDELQESVQNRTKIGVITRTDIIKYAIEMFHSFETENKKEESK